MAFTHPHGKIILGHPGYNGVETLIGSSFDWRPDALDNNGECVCPWSLWGMEFVQPLRCLAPVADARPRAMIYDPRDAYDPQLDAGLVPWWTLRTGSENESIRTCNVTGNPTTQWLHFFDATIFPTNTVGASAIIDSPSTMHAARIPRFVLHTVRYAPPMETRTTKPADGYVYEEREVETTDEEGNTVTVTVYDVRQGSRSALAVAMQAFCLRGGWYTQSGTLSLVLPLADETQPDPFLHWISDDDAADAQDGGGSWTYWTHGQIISTAPRALSPVELPHQCSWLFEVEDDGSNAGTLETEKGWTGSHILIRSSAASDKWWHTYLPGMRFIPAQTTEPWRIAVAGAVTYFNLTQLRYGEGDFCPGGEGVHVQAGALPRDPATLPNAGDSTTVWEPAATYDLASQDAKGWVTDALSWTPDGDGLYRPYLTARRLIASAWGVRPLIWLGAEDHATTIGSATTTTWDSTGQKRVEAMEYTVDAEWRGSRGSVQFRPAFEEVAFAVENARCDLYMGWDADADADLRSRLVASAYVLPGGVSRSSEGSERSGAPMLTLEVGDFSLARMPEKEAFDFRQAGGRRFGDWARDVAGRLGLPSSMLYIAHASLEAARIPLGATPWEPTLAAEDGSSWDAHLEAVCRAMSPPGASKVRWGFGKYAPGALFFDFEPTYAGTTDFTLDQTTLTAKDLVYRVEHTESVTGHTNLLKVIGPEGALYAAASKAARIAWGDTWAKVARYELGQNPREVAYRTWLERNEWHEAIVWDGPMRPAIMPDAFVAIGSAEVGMGLTSGMVFRVVTHAMRSDRLAGEATSTMEAVRVL